MKRKKIINRKLKSINQLIFELFDLVIKYPKWDLRMKSKTNINTKKEVNIEIHYQRHQEQHDYICLAPLAAVMITGLPLGCHRQKPRCNDLNNAYRVRSHMHKCYN